MAGEEPERWAASVEGVGTELKGRRVGAAWVMAPGVSLQGALWELVPEATQMV